MNNDLISREALKKYLEDESYTYPSDEEFGCGFNECLLQVFMAIDNAPTVEYPFYQEAYQTGYEEGKNEKPQGKWLFKNGKYRCSHCGEKAIYRFSGSLSTTQTELLTVFCPNCGVKMERGDKE